MKKIYLTVVTAPIKVNYICPNCDEEISENYNYFESSQYSNYPLDWETTHCPECGQEIKIEQVEWE